MAAEKNGRVSVIIPAFNSERFLAGAINSVLSQTYGNIECIVVDDGSNDNTAAIAKSYGRRILYAYKTNAERSAARNTGIGIATGQYISFLDADDSLASGKIAEQVDFLEGHPECGAVYSKVKFFRENEERLYFILHRPTPAGDILAPLLHGNFITVHSPLIRKSAVEAVGGFTPDLSHNEDWEFFLRLALSGISFGFLDEYHAFCRMHQSNTSRDEIRMHESKWQVINTFVSAHAEKLQRKQIDVQKELAYHEADYGKALIVYGRVNEGRHHIFTACRNRFPQRNKYLFFALASFLLNHKLLERAGRKGHLYGNGE